MENITKMNRLIIIGNGFDLAHGMKTRYEDFLLDYLNKLISDANFTCNYSLIERKSVFISQYQYSEVKKVYNNLLKYEIINKNSISHFVKELLNRNPNQRWVDIEKVFYTNLIAGLTRIEFDNIIDLNNDLEKIKNLLHNYLLRLDDPKINKKFNDIFNQPIFTNFITKYTFLEIKVPSTIVFLNFNYTNTIDQYFSNFHSNSNSYVINIHGQLNDPKNPIIFGYGDEMDENYKLLEDKNDNEYLKNFKTFQYSKTSNYKNLERFVESLPFEVFVIGHSCGLSDRVLLNYVFEHENCKSIRVYYYKNEENYLNTVMDISRHFKNKQSVRSKVVTFNLSEPCPQWDDE